MEIITAEEMAQSLSQIIERTKHENIQYKVVSPQGSIVLLSEEAYDNLLVTLECLATPGLLESLPKISDAADECPQGPQGQD